MRRVPLWFAVMFELLLICMACNGNLNQGGIIILIINAIALIPALYRYFVNRSYRIEYRNTLKIKRQIDNSIQTVLNEKEKVINKVEALIDLNNVFVIDKNRKYISLLTDNYGNEWTEYLMQIFIAHHSQKLIENTDVSELAKERLEKLLQNKCVFASQRVTPIKTTKRFFKILRNIAIMMLVVFVIAIIFSKKNNSQQTEYTVVAVNQKVENEDVACLYSSADFVKEIVSTGGLLHDEVLTPADSQGYLLDIVFVVADKENESATAIKDLFNDVILYIDGKEIKTQYDVIYFHFTDKFINVRDTYWVMGSFGAKHYWSTDLAGEDEVFHIVIPFEREKVENNNSSISVKIKSCLGNMEIQVR